MADVVFDGRLLRVSLNQNQEASYRTSTGHDIQQITDTYTAPKRPGKDVKSAFLSTARLFFQEEPRFLKGPVKIKVVVKENLEIIGEVSSKGSIIFPTPWNLSVSNSDDSKVSRKVRCDGSNSSNIIKWIMIHGNITNRFNVYLDQCTLSNRLEPLKIETCSQNKILGTFSVSILIYINASNSLNNSLWRCRDFNDIFKGSKYISATSKGCPTRTVTNITVNEGDYNVTFVCNVGKNQMVDKIKWNHIYGNTTIRTDQELQSYSEEQNLTFPNVVFEDTGIYQCKEGNILNDNKNELIASEWKLTVRTPPKFAKTDFLFYMDDGQPLDIIIPFFSEPKVVLSGILVKKKQNIGYGHVYIDNYSLQDHDIALLFHGRRVILKGQAFKWSIKNSTENYEGRYLLYTENPVLLRSNVPFEIRIREKNAPEQYNYLSPPFTYIYFGCLSLILSIIVVVVVYKYCKRRGQTNLGSISQTIEETVQDTELDKSEPEAPEPLQFSLLAEADFEEEGSTRNSESTNESETNENGNIRDSDSYEKIDVENLEDDYTRLQNDNTT